MRATLLPGMEVRIPPRALRMGGSWDGPCGPDGLRHAWGEEEIQLFYDSLSTMDSPVFLDIGASTGSFCLLAKFVPGSRCIAFEPHRQSYEVLIDNIRMNDLRGRVIPLNLALFDSPGEAELKIPSSGKKAGLSCIGDPIRFKEWVIERVEQATLDSVIKAPMEKLEASKVDLVKIDTEGAELGVIQGARQVLSSWKPPILLEYYPPNAAQFGYKAGEIVDLLIKYGYKRFTKVGVDDMWAEATW